MRKKHGLLPQTDIEIIDQPQGILITKAAKGPRSNSVIASMMRGGAIKGTTADWLRLTRAK
jgi:hypothetical protein